MREVRDLAQADSPAAYAKVKEKMLNADKDSTQLAAALAILKMAGVAMTPDEMMPQAPQANPAARQVTRLETGKLLSLKSVSSTMPQSPPSSGDGES